MRKSAVRLDGNESAPRVGVQEESDEPSSSHSDLISMTCRAYSRDVMTSSNQRMTLGGGWCWNMLELG